MSKFFRRCSCCGEGLTSENIEFIGRNHLSGQLTFWFTHLKEGCESTMISQKMSEQIVIMFAKKKEDFYDKTKERTLESEPGVPDLLDIKLGSGL